MTVPPVLHELEAEVMEHVWRQPDATIRGVMQAINASHERQRSYSTIATIMHRLNDKGVLTRKRRRRTDVYAPAFSKQEYLAARAAAQVQAVVGEFGDVALVHFAREMDKLDPKRREQLRRLARRP